MQHSIQSLWKQSAQQLKQATALLAPADPVSVFHHIPKCGGTSMNQVLEQWFLTVRDYRKPWTQQYPEQVDLTRLRSPHCLCGHFSQDGYHLYQRYPEVFTSDRFRVFTFLRDPLQLQLSLFRYEKQNGLHRDRPLEVHLQVRPNYIAHCFPVTLDNYVDVLDRYFFVGILEESHASLAALAHLLGKPPAQLPYLNATQDPSHTATKASASVDGLSPEVIAQFREANHLDYLIYQYGLNRLHQRLDRVD